MDDEEVSAHRPWPVPERPWVMRMRWKELLFAHWPVAPSALRPLIPPGLELDTFDGRCWVGAVPFLMEDVSPRGVPAIPGLHAFPEVNLRTYVVAEGKPGVWFFSLDAGQKLAVRAARRFFHLPYFDARFQIEIGERIDYRSERIGAVAVFDATYRPVGEVYRSTPGSFDAWLTERYCLYSADGAGRVYRVDIDHQPWPLQPAEAEIRENTLGEWLGIPLRGAPQALHYAKSIDVHAWFISSLTSGLAS
jgi:uncharacterized protein YqjF (DUF2071 family)